ncbi:hypothetical protein EDB81DRAFT_914339 [Dactylonectria macrodidyma]|uniref:NADH-cytochrome b5 reductase 2 n=1 Tax=Dactylonectria macrodidyma TaxID=307937 RepID=A0A9P9IHB2_9HYPO|nr:hypothetical protein EDB81DRAFT_914339 [Dactylonectria macrodidyma]
MFARSTFRATQPLNRSARRYATEAGGVGDFNALPYAAGAIGIAGGVYWYFSGASAPATAAKIRQAVGPESKKAFTGGDQGFLSLQVADVETVNHNTKLLRFKLPKPDQVSGLTVASAILTKYEDPEDKTPILRPYTPIEEGEKGFLNLLVKKYPNGLMSTHIHHLTPGQHLDIMGPIPKYSWDENKHEHIALIGGGTGITPLYQLARAIFNNPNDRTKVTLVFGNVTEEDILLKKQLDELERAYPQRFSVFYVLSKPSEEWTGGKGHISKDLLKTILPSPKSKNIKLFVCGPPGLMKAMSGNMANPIDQGELTGALQELGYSKGQVYKF